MGDTTPFNLMPTFPSLVYLLRTFFPSSHAMSRPAFRISQTKKALETRAQQRVKSAFDVTTKHRLDDWTDESRVPHQTSANRLTQRSLTHEQIIHPAIARVKCVGACARAHFRCLWQFKSRLQLSQACLCRLNSSRCRATLGFGCYGFNRPYQFCTGPTLQSRTT